MASVTELMKTLELRQHLRRSLGAWHSTVKLDDVAEFASERTSPRILHAYIKILVELEKIEPRNRTRCHVCLELLRREHTGPHTQVPGSDEFVDNSFRLTENPEIRRGVDMRARGHVGTSDDAWLAMALTELDHLQRIGLLVQHTAGHAHVGPVEVWLSQILSIAIDE